MRRTLRAARARLLTGALLGAALLGAGCAPSPVVRDSTRLYDLGPPPATVPMAQAPRALLKVAAVTAPAPLDTDAIAYRLVYTAPRELRRYGNSKWAATPAQLLTQRLRGALAPRVTVLDSGDSEAAPRLTVTLLDFSQRFDAPGAGRGVVALRASLQGDGRPPVQRDFSAAVPSPSGDAAGGAQAIADATDQTLAQLSDWVLASLASRSPQSRPPASTPAY